MFATSIIPSMDISIIIPTYNGADRLSAVLAALRQQIGIENLRGEIFVIDNNSTDTTADVIQQFQQSWQFAFPLHYRKELRQGAGYARQQGARIAQGELLAYLDDDNWPSTNWVSEAVAFAKLHPKAGAFGSRISPFFESPPSQELRPILPYLAIVERGDSPHLYQPHKNGTPPSAGLVIRREAWLHAIPDQLFLIGRVGQSMLAGEDSELLIHLHKANWQLWHNPDMQISHYIPINRLQASYLKKNLLGIGLCRYYLRMLVLPIWKRPMMTLLYIISDSAKLLRHYLKYGTKIKEDLVPSCEYQLLLGNLISPFYLSKIKLQRSLERYNKLHDSGKISMSR